MARRPACRFCGLADGALRPVSTEGEGRRHMTASRRAALARLDRLDPVVEHEPCYVAALAEHEERRRLYAAVVAHSRDVRASGDVDGYLALLERLDDATTSVELRALLPA